MIGKHAYNIKGVSVIRSIVSVTRSTATGISISGKLSIKKENKLEKIAHKVSIYNCNSTNSAIGASNNVAKATVQILVIILLNMLIIVKLNEAHSSFEPINIR